MHRPGHPTDLNAATHSDAYAAAHATARAAAHATARANATPLPAPLSMPPRHRTTYGARGAAHNATHKSTHAAARATLRGPGAVTLHYPHSTSTIPVQYKYSTSTGPVQGECTTSTVQVQRQYSTSTAPVQYQRRQHQCSTGTARVQPRDHTGTSTRITQHKISNVKGQYQYIPQRNMVRTERPTAAETHALGRLRTIGGVSSGNEAEQSPIGFVDGAPMSGDLVQYRSSPGKHWERKSPCRRRGAAPRRQDVSEVGLFWHGLGGMPDFRLKRQVGPAVLDPIGPGLRMPGT